MHRIMNKTWIVLAVMCVCSLFFSSAVSAYSLDDVKKDYPKFKVKTENIENDAGAKTKIRSGQIMKMYGTNSGRAMTMWFYLQEINDSKKEVRISVVYDGYDWEFWNRLTIGDGKNAFNVYPYYKPRHEIEGRHTVEYLTFYINNADSYNLWNNAKKITIKGSKHYETFKMNSIEYQRVMNIIQRFMFE